MQNDYNFEKEHNNYFFKYKILAYPDILYKLMQGMEVAPINLEVNLTNVCNHDCIWCTYGYLHDNHQKLDVDIVKRLLDDAREMGVKSVVWTGGGEPTVHSHFFELISYANKLGFKQGLNTNGELLDEKTIDFIGQSFSYVRFSIDSASNKTSEICHRAKSNSYEKIILNLKKLVQAKQKHRTDLVIGYSFLVDSHNIDEVELATITAKNIGVNYIQFKPIVNYDGNNDLFIEDSEFRDHLYKTLEGVQKFSDQHFQVLVLQHKFTNIAAIDYGRNYDKCFGCKLLASVGANGMVDLCCAYKGIEGFGLGNIYESSFKDIWYSSMRENILNRIDVKKCPPMCKADEINKLVDFLMKFDANKEFI